MSVMSEPRPPENVRIVRADGTEIPCELRYTGTRIADDGKPLHTWEALTEYLPQIPQDTVRMDTLPPRTEISLAFRGPKEWESDDT